MVDRRKTLSGAGKELGTVARKRRQLQSIGWEVIRGHSKTGSVCCGIASDIKTYPNT